MIVSERKRQRLASATAAATAMSIDDLGYDMKAKIFSYLDWPDTLHEYFCKKWASGASIQDLTEFTISTPKHHDAAAWVAFVAPNLQKLGLAQLPWNYRYKRGEESVKELFKPRPPGTPHWTNDDEEEHTIYELDVKVAGYFKNIQHLEITSTQLNGIYPNLFNFSRLRKLSVRSMHLKWDLAMLSGMTLLEELKCSYCNRLSGDIKSLRTFRETLLNVHIDTGEGGPITGDFMELADFPRLEELQLSGTDVTGDVRKIQECHFLSLRKIALPKSVFGGRYFERISDAPEIMAALYPLKKRAPELFEDYDWSLSETSPDYYQMNNIPECRAPFNVHFVKAGSRLGWRWSSGSNHVGGHWVQHCETHWLDPEPPRDDLLETFCYDRDLKELGYGVQRYKGFLEPPSETQYTELLNASSHQSLAMMFSRFQRGYHGFAPNW